MSMTDAIEVRLRNLKLNVNSKLVACDCICSNCPILRHKNEQQVSCPTALNNIKTEYDYIFKLSITELKETYPELLI